MNQKACLIMSLVYFSVMSWLGLVGAGEVRLTSSCVQITTAVLVVKAPMVYHLTARCCCQPDMTLTHHT